MKMNIKINIEKMTELGYNFKDIQEIFLYAKELIEYLASHNKNYNSKQYYNIEELKEIFHFIEIEA